MSDTTLIDRQSTADGRLGSSGNSQRAEVTLTKCAVAGATNKRNTIVLITAPNNPVIGAGRENGRPAALLTATGGKQPNIICRILKSIIDNQ